MAEVTDIRCDEARFFPQPGSMFRENGQWRQITSGYQRAWMFDGLQVIASAATMRDGREWLHVSFSRRSRLPTYADLQLVKREFIGSDRKAIMVFPEEKHHVNIHPNCLHLWYSADNPLPEFSVGGSI